MKTIKILIVSLFLFVGTTSMAQLKLAHLNSQEIISLMPDMADVQTNMQAFQKELSDTYEGMQAEYRTKMAELQKNVSTMANAIVSQKEKELNDIRTNIEAFSENAQQDLEKKRMELFQPVIKKVQDAIAAVGKENGFTYIIDSSTGSLVYIDEATAIDASTLVKTKLGIK